MATVMAAETSTDRDELQATYNACRTDMQACGIDLAGHLRAMLPLLIRMRLLAREASRAATALGKPSDVERYHLATFPDALQALLRGDEAHLKVACDRLSADWRDGMPVSERR